MTPDANPALRLLRAHLQDRAAMATRIAQLADEAWQEWLDRPTFERATLPQAEAWLDSERRQAAVLVDVALRPKWCTVEVASDGTVAILVGLA